MHFGTCFPTKLWSAPGGGAARVLYSVQGSKGKRKAAAASVFTAASCEQEHESV